MAKVEVKIGSVCVKMAHMSEKEKWGFTHPYQLISTT